MQIAAASISLQATHSLIRRDVQVRQPAPAASPPPSAATAKSDATDVTAASPADPVLALLKTLVERLTGQPVRVFSAADLPRIPDAGRAAASGNPPAAAAAAAPLLAWREEREHTGVSAEGRVLTADGREIVFRLSLDLDRVLREHISGVATAPPRKDPLVLSFDGASVRIDAGGISFDLTGEGAAGRLPLLADGSAYLAYDRNGNGRIDSGRELFGPVSDNGFAELAALDGDGNGWIDAADPGFAALRLWRPQADGSGHLQTLAAAGVGALGLAHVASPFALDGGQLIASGVFIGEDGRVGAVQEIDADQ